MDSIWTLDIAIEGTLGVATGDADLSLHYSPLQVTLDSDFDGSQLTVDPKTVSGTFTAQFGGTAGDATASGVAMLGSQITNPSVQVTRRLEFDDDDLTVNEGPGDQPDGTMRIIADLTFDSVKYSVQFASPEGTTAHSGNVASGVRFKTDAPYDPTQTDQRAQGPLFEGQMLLKGTGTIKIKRKVCTLTYTPSAAADTKGDATLAAMNGYTPMAKSGTAAYGPALSTFIHGNSHIALVVNGVDRGARFKTIRKMRIWQAEPLPDGTLGPAVGGPWKIDTSAAGASWDDRPGFKSTELPSQWIRRRQVQEFLVTPKGIAEFDGIYYMVVIDYGPGGIYRLRMSAQEHVKLKTQWSQILKDPAPHHDENTMSYVVDTGNVLVADPPVSPSPVPSPQTP
jgi:hypothetical protein